MGQSHPRLRWVPVTMLPIRAEQATAGKQTMRQMSRLSSEERSESVAINLRSGLKTWACCLDRCRVGSAWVIGP